MTADPPLAPDPVDPNGLFGRESPRRYGFKSPLWPEDEFELDS